MAPVAMQTQVLLAGGDAFRLPFVLIKHFFMLCKKGVGLRAGRWGWLWVSLSLGAAPRLIGKQEDGWLLLRMSSFFHRGASLSCKSQQPCVPQGSAGDTRGASPTSVPAKLVLVEAGLEVRGDTVGALVAFLDPLPSLAVLHADGSNTCGGTHRGA